MKILLPSQVGQIQLRQLSFSEVYAYASCHTSPILTEPVHCDAFFCFSLIGLATLQPDQHAVKATTTGNIVQDDADQSKL